MSALLLAGFSLVLSLVAFTIAVINYRRACANLRAAKAKRVKAEAHLANFERAYGLDLSDVDRAAWVRAKWRDQP